MRTLPLALVSVLVAVLPHNVTAQRVRAVGLIAGRVESKHVLQRSEDSQHREALTVGAFGEVTTPKSWLDIGIQLTFVPRGGKYPVPTSGGPEALTAEVQADYLTFSLVPTGRLAVGPVSVFVFAGPSLDLYLRGGAAADVAAGFRDASTQVLAATAGFGVDVAGPRGTTLGAEIRHDEGLGTAYQGVSERLRHRSRSVSVRFGFRPSR